MHLVMRNFTSIYFYSIFIVFYQLDYQYRQFSGYSYFDRQQIKFLVKLERIRQFCQFAWIKRTKVSLLNKTVTFEINRKQILEIGLRILNIVYAVLYARKGIRVKFGSNSKRSCCRYETAAEFLFLSFYQILQLQIQYLLNHKQLIIKEMKLGFLLQTIQQQYHCQGLEVFGDISTIQITGINIDHRLVEPGNLFVALKGAATDGHFYIKQAIQIGAAAILCQQIPQWFQHYPQNQARHEKQLSKNEFYLQKQSQHAPSLSSKNTQKEQSLKHQSKFHKNNVVYIQIKHRPHIYKILGPLCTIFHHNPSHSLNLIGVTGTNGKTTTATLLYHTFKLLGHKVGLISTICNYINESSQPIPTLYTTPEAVTLNNLLRRMAENGCEYVFMEVSSHSTVEERIRGLRFKGGVFTNFSQDHLDYHGSMEEYFSAKKRFFSEFLDKEAFCLTNVGDERGLEIVEGTKAKVYTYNIFEKKGEDKYKFKQIMEENQKQLCKRDINEQQCDFSGKIQQLSLFSGMLLSFNGMKLPVKEIGGGYFNAANLLAVFGVANLLLGIQTQKRKTQGQGQFGKETQLLKILEAMSCLHPVSGRFEIVRSPSNKYIGIVDYAHTPDALGNVLKAINDALHLEAPQFQHSQGEKRQSRRIITVIGAGGNRDKSKRPLMAQQAANLSDIVILTSDNPRHQQPQDIIQDMEKGLQESVKWESSSQTKQKIDKKIFKIVDRRQAINKACTLAKEGDVVLIAGKGHQKYQDIKGVRHHFDDREELRKVMMVQKKKAEREQKEQIKDRMPEFINREQEHLRATQ